MQRAPWTRRREGISTTPHEPEGRRGLRINDRHGGRYLNIPSASPIVPLAITPASKKSGPKPNDPTAPVLASS
jgi:hypothetical protein